MGAIWRCINDEPSTLSFVLNEELATGEMERTRWASSAGPVLAALRCEGGGAGGERQSAMADPPESSLIRSRVRRAGVGAVVEHFLLIVETVAVGVEIAPGRR